MYLLYLLPRVGEYGIHVKYNDQHVPDSPTFVYIAPECGDAKLVTVQGVRDKGNSVSGISVCGGSEIHMQCRDSDVHVSLV